MAPRTRQNRGKAQAVEVPENSNIVGETPQELLLAIKEVMKDITQHRIEMATQMNAVNGRQTEPTPSS